MEEKIIMLRRSTYILIAFILLLAACNSPGPSAPTAVGPTVTPNPNATPSPTPFGPAVNPPTMAVTIPEVPTTASVAPTSSPTQVPAPVFAPSFYTLTARLDYAAHSLAVDESIFYQNATGEILFTLVLAVEPNIWTGCFVLSSLMVNGQDVIKTSLTGNRLEVPLAVPLVPGGALEMSLHYDLHLPPADSHHVFGYNNRQTNLVDWYPFIVPYSGGWVLHPPAEVGENLVYDAETFDVTLTLTDPAVPVTVAASAPEDVITGGWHYHLQNARTFVFSASPAYAYQSASTTTNGVTITSYFFSEEELQGQVVLNEVAKALTTFGEIFGPSPYPSLSVVESPFFDGMEYDGLFFLSQDFYTTYDGTELNNLIDLAVHETAHQWWFGLVGNDQALDPWLDEALATYSEELFFEKNIPNVTAWWVFRVDSFAPTGWVDTDIYQGTNFRTYANAVYLRGAYFLDALRKLTGDNAFSAFLKDYATQMTYKRATPADFFRILREHTNADLSEIISSYFQRHY